MEDSDPGTPTRVAVIYSNAGGLTKTDQSFTLDDFRNLGGSAIWSDS